MAESCTPAQEAQLVEGIGRVVALGAETAVIEAESKAACGGCASRSACSVPALSSLGGKRPIRFALANSFDARIGDRVVVGFPATAMVGASLLLYLLPALGLIGGAVVGEAVSGSGLGAALGALVGGYCGFWPARRAGGAGKPVFLRRLAALFLVVLLGACDRPPSTLHETHYIFGTLVEVIIRDDDPAKAQMAANKVVALFHRLHRDWHAWRPGELYRVNEALAAGRAVTVSDDLKAVILQARDLSRQSEGLFNPAIGAIVAAWGFHDDTPPDGGRPPLERIRALAALAPSMDDLHFDGNSLTSTNPAVSLDFGGFAKGLALDRGMALLKSLGIRHAILNAGGDLNVMGDAQGRPWKVGIRAPKGWGLLTSVEAQDGDAVYTSGNYERFRDYEGVRYAHILDPRSGMPVSRIVSVTVIGKEGGLADAAATALSVAGPDDWRRIARAMGVQKALLVDADGHLDVI